MSKGGFLDEAVVTFTSGKGGKGSAAFLREKHVPRGGPIGANGGRGGDVVLVADHHKRTLYDFQLRDHYEAENGSDAIGSKSGKDGSSTRILVPVGTIVSDVELDEIVADLSVHGAELTICKGGRGGFGNQHYVNSVRQAPTFAQNGAPAEQVIAKLELKLIAEVGLIGLPNAGKSTLLAAMSAAKPKIGAYPFTTIAPNLGVVSVGDYTFTMADLPGLIEGASEGVGLGHQFLKHAERNKVLLHVVDALPLDGSYPHENFQLIEDELRKFSSELADRPRIVALNKLDLVQPEDRAIILEFFEGIEFPIVLISGATGEGIEDLKYDLWKIIEKTASEEIQPTILKPIVDHKRDDQWSIEQTEEGFMVKGDRVERLVAMTDLENRDAIHYLYRKLQRIGVIARLEEMGAEDGDLVVVANFEFTYTDW